MCVFFFLFYLFALESKQALSNCVLNEIFILMHDFSTFLSKDNNNKKVITKIFEILFENVNDYLIILCYPSIWRVKFFKFSFCFLFLELSEKCKKII